MKAVVFAYHNMGIAGLDALFKSGFDIKAVFTHEDDPGENCWFGSVKKWANQKNIAVYTTEEIGSPEWIEKIAAFNPTPELVHGVVISSPELAEELRKAGYFAGPSKKKPTEYIPINKEMDGLTVVVNEIGESMWDQENLETDSISVSNLD